MAATTREVLRWCDDKGCNFGLHVCVWIAKRSTRSSGAPRVRRKRSRISAGGYQRPNVAVSNGRPLRPQSLRRRVCHVEPGWSGLESRGLASSGWRNGSQEGASGSKKRAKETPANCGERPTAEPVVNAQSESAAHDREKSARSRTTRARDWRIAIRSSFRANGR